MPTFQRDGASIAGDVSGRGFPVLLFAPGGMRSRAEMWRTSAELAKLLPNVEVRQNWRGPEHLAEQRRGVTEFLVKHTPR